MSLEDMEPMTEERIDKAYRRKSATYGARREHYEASGYFKKGKQTAFEEGYYDGQQVARYRSWLSFITAMTAFGYDGQYPSKNERYKTEKSRADYQLGFDLGYWEWDQ